MCLPSSPLLPWVLPVLRSTIDTATSIITLSLLILVLDPEIGVMLHPLPYLGVAHSLVLIFHFYVYHQPAFPFIPDLPWQLPLSRYLAVINPTHLHLLTLCLPSYFIYVFHVTYSYLRILLYDSSPLLAVCVSQFLSYLHILFCYLLSTILHISQPIAKALAYSPTM